jgi:four helix bundle protein
MTPEEMKERTLQLGLRVIRVVEALPRRRASDVIGRQFLKCGTSVGANYRASCRSRSDGDFVARMGVVEEEADETIYWLEVTSRSNLLNDAMLRPLIKECDEILLIVVASIKTVKSRLARERR